MNEFTYIRVPFYIPKYWALKGHYDERYTKPFKMLMPDEKSEKAE